MKKFLSLALVALLSLSMIVAVSAEQLTFTAAMGTPVIDGKMDDAYSVAEEIQLNYTEGGNGLTHGTCRILWDEDNIYAFFDIVDPVITNAVGEKFWQSDSAEFFIDVSGAPSDNILEINAAQYTATAVIDSDAYGTFQGRGGHWDANVKNCSYVTTHTETGYTVEMQIAWGEDYTPKANAEIGVSFQINSDEDGYEGRENMVWANEGQINASAWTFIYDTLVLSSEKYEAPVDTTAAPADTTTAPADTTAAPADTTAAPADTTAAPATDDTQAPATFDIAIIAAAVAIASGASAVIVSKKRK